MGEEKLNWLRIVVTSDQKCDCLRFEGSSKEGWRLRKRKNEERERGGKDGGGTENERRERERAWGNEEGGIVNVKRGGRKIKKESGKEDKEKENEWRKSERGRDGK